METQEFKDKVLAVGAILGMVVEFYPDEDMRWYRWAILTKDAQKIRISNGTNGEEHKLHISGDFPRTIKGESVFYGISQSAINVSESKTPEQIARDLERRFLPVYLPELEKTVERVKETNIYYQKREANIEKLAKYFGVEFKEDNQEPQIYVYDKIKGLGSRIEAYGEDTVKFELELTPEMAIKVFDLLKEVNDNV